MKREQSESKRGGCKPSPLKPLTPEAKCRQAQWLTVTSLVPSGLHSYQVRFVERYCDRNGFRMNAMPDSHWVALVHTQISAAPGQALNNPAGIQMVASQWSRETFPLAAAP